MLSNAIYLCPGFLEQEINRSLSPPLQGPLPPPCPTPSAPQPRELITIEEESERLARELKEVHSEIQEDSTFWMDMFPLLSFAVFSTQVSRNRDSLRAQLTQLCQYKGVLTRTHSLTATQVMKAAPASVGATNLGWSDRSTEDNTI